MNAEDFMELLNAEQDNFTFEKYDLFDNNCNHFSNFCTEMLLGKSIPNEYLNQAEEFKGTPIYNMLKGMQVNMNNNRNNYNISYQGFQQSGNGEPTAQRPFPRKLMTAPTGTPNLPNYGQMGMNSFNPPPPAKASNSNIVEVRDLLHFLQVTQDNPMVIVDFYATWCGPCKAIEPLFDQLEAKYRGKGGLKERV